MHVHVFRLVPGDDLKSSLIKFIQDNHIKAGVVITCVGSLSTATIRLAKNLEIKTYSDTFEIVSLVGTISVSRTHLHIAISNSQGQTIGGHLMDKCIVHTTAEVAIGEIENLEFTKVPDKLTGFDELGVLAANEK